MAKNKSIRFEQSERNLVGLYVYEVYNPQTPGIIIEDLGFTVGKVRVKFINGTEKTIYTSSLNNFKSLIEDHRKKLKTHESKLSLLATIKS